jgi:phenylacetic acid degradation protein paaN
MMRRFGVAHPLFEKHQNTLHKALAATRSRLCWSPYAEVSAGDTALNGGDEAIEAYRGAQFYLDQPGVIGRCGNESSPYGLALSIAYPQCAPDALIAAAKVASGSWGKLANETRVGLCLEALERLHQGGSELAQALMHTTGQALSLARSQGVTQALARGLEAVAVAWREMSAVSPDALWERPAGAQGAVQVHKRYVVAPRGVGLLLTCANAPTWMAYPALFASLATGNAVIIKPHPTVILPLALTVAVLRQTLKENGFDANLVSLLVDESDAPATRELAVHPDIALIDYSGPRELGEWLREHARQARVFCFHDATNCAVIDSTHDYKGMLRYLVASLAWYSGQMPSSPQNVFIPAGGIATDEGVVSAAQFSRDLAYALGKLCEEPARAAEVLGAILSPATLAHLDSCNASESLIRASTPIEHPRWPSARLRTPVVLAALPSDEALFAPPQRGATVFVITVATTAGALVIAERVMSEQGALELLLYTTNPPVQSMAEEVAMRAGVRLSSNFSGTMAQAMILNLPAAFSDFQGGGANPASNATLVDGQFVSRRFSFAELRSRQVVI